MAQSESDGGLSQGGQAKGESPLSPLVLPTEFQGHESDFGLPGARKRVQITRGTKESWDYQGHERELGLPGARNQIWSTKGTKSDLEYQGHERRRVVCYWCSPWGVLKCG